MRSGSDQQFSGVWRRKEIVPIAAVCMLAALALSPVVSQAQDVRVCEGMAVTVDLQLGQLATDGDDVIGGTGGDDVIAAGAGNDLICAGGGNDTVFGQDGDDRILGEGGDDRIRGGDGDDELLGQDGADDMAGGRGNDIVDGGEGDDTALRGGTGDDVVSGGAGDEVLIAGNGGEDEIHGGPGNDRLTGGPRPDTLRGGAGDDELKGNKGADVLRGDAGNDTIKGGPQPDLLDGGFGTDECASGTVPEGSTLLDTFRDCESRTNLHPIPDSDGDGTPDRSDPAPDNPARTGALAPLFPIIDGRPQLPPGPAASQLDWFLDQLAAPSTSLADVESHFAPGSLSAAQWRDFIDQVRTAHPAADVVEVLHTVPNDLAVIVAAPGATNAAIVVMSTGLADERLTALGAFPWQIGGSVLAPGDANRTMAQTISAYESVADGTSVLVAQISEDGCTSIAESSADTPRAIGSIFKVWVLAALAEAVETGDLSLDTPVALSAEHIPPVGTILGDEPLGTSLSVLDMARLMMGVSDNAATDHLLALLDRSELEASLTEFGHGHADAMTPFLSTNEAFQLYWGVPEEEALAFAAGSNEFQQDYLDTVLAPLGPVTEFPYANDSILIDGSWQASPLDVCNAMVALRGYPQDSDAMRLVDEAYGAQAALPNTRGAWDRVWYKGGSLASNRGLHVLTHGFVLESDDRGAYAVITMANTDAPPINEGAVFSLTARLVELVGQL